MLRICTWVGLWLGLVTAASATPDGTLSVEFYPHVLNGIGLPLSDVTQTATPENASYLGFAVTGFEVDGGFALGGESVDLTIDLSRVLTKREVDIGPALVLKRSHRGEGRWMQGDLTIAPDYARRLGMPEHTGRVVGLADLVLAPALDPVAREPDGEKGGDCEAPFGPEVDVAITDLNDIGAVAWNEDLVAFAPSAVLENVGDTSIFWYWAIRPLWFNGPNLGQHPYLVLHLYRLDDQGLEQIAASDLKHAWNTINFDCPCPGGQVMYPGCTDEYGVSNNNNQFYFGPRDELTAHRGEFTSLGSHFDGTPVDDFRSHEDQPGEHSMFDHRLVARTADLVAPDARYFVEAWYIAQGDNNLWNSIAHREVRPTFDVAANLWTIPFTGPFQSGPAIQVLEAEGGTVESMETSEGTFLLASETTRLAEGNQYRYTFMNMDFDRQISNFQLPCARGALRDVVFRDGDMDTTNDWTFDGTSSFGGSGLDWGRMSSVAFTTDSFSLPDSATVGALESGDAPTVSIAAASVPKVLLSELPLITISPEVSGGTGQPIRCRWNALPGARYDVQVSTDNLEWTSRGVTVVPNSNEGEYMEVPDEVRLSYRVQLIELP